MRLYMMELEYASGTNGFSDKEKLFQGTFWDSKYHMMEVCFEADGTYRINTHYQYDVTDKSLILKGKTGETEYFYSYDDQSEKLTLKYGEEGEFVFIKEE